MKSGGNPPMQAAAKMAKMEAIRMSSVPSEGASTALGDTYSPNATEGVAPREESIREGGREVLLSLGSRLLDLDLG